MAVFVRFCRFRRLRGCSMEKRARQLPKKYRHAGLSLLKALVCAVVIASFITCVALYYPESDFHFWGYWVFAILYLVVFLSIANMYRCFNIGVLRRRELTFSFCMASFLTNFIMYFVLSLLCKYMIDPIPLLVMLLAQWIAGALLLLLANRVFFLLRPVRKAIMVCSRDLHEKATLDKFLNMRDSYQIEETVSESLGYDALVDRISGYSTVITGEIEMELRQTLVNFCFDNNKRLFILPSVQDIILHNAHETFVGDSVVYLCKNRPFTIEQLAVKRLIDISVSLLGIIVTSPIMLVTALLIKLHDGGPVFFRQVRYTRNLQKFTLIKFRSMVVDAEKDGARFTTDNDPRITPIGRFLRRTRIDELPQFFNILRGEMSLVGPRAERIENVDYYCEMLPEFRYRMKVKAGLTGYAQIYGKYNTSYEDKLKLDLLYIENCSIIQDLQLLFLTVRVLFIPDSTEGFQTKTIEEMDTETQKQHDDLQHTA